MPRIPLNERSVLEIIGSIDNGCSSVFYPYVLSLTIQGRPKEIRLILEKLVDKGVLERYKSKVPLVYCIVGYGYHLK